MTEPGINVYRGGHLESQHHIHIAVVNTKRELLYSYGDPTRATFARSSMKPLQAIPVIETGTIEAFNLEPADIAVMCASHNGEPIHRSRVLSILEKVGQPEETLQCGTHIPRDIESYKALIREGKELSPVFSNCSGKHSGMIATAVHLHEDLDRYYILEHPVQQRILNIISELLDFPKEKIGIGIDGCGVPVHQLPLNYIALGFAYLANPDTIKDDRHSQALSIIRDAMMAHPELVAGKDRFDTDVMRAFKGRIVSKAGAEGVQCVGDAETGIGIAIKAEDGNGRAVMVAMMEVFKQLGIGNEEVYEKLSNYVETPIKNMKKEIIGIVKPSFTLKKH
ncbi:asparaginase [Brassicibacter mesophilus]|uniref:asparaginase n=1 Tax=Brassicibacter mesophilus TaxID=745119 RepID=UPI003D1A989C